VHYLTVSRSRQLWLRFYQGVPRGWPCVLRQLHPWTYRHFRSATSPCSQKGSV
jgi:hypothetical protein